MRKIEGYTPSIEREFIPSAFDNRLDPTPVKVWIRTPTELEKRQVNAKGSTAKIALDENGNYEKDSNGNPKVQIDIGDEISRQVEVVRLFVTKVENYFAAGGSPITTGDELSRFGETPFISEIYAEVLTGMSLKEQEIKKSERPSDYTRKATQASNGTAPFAGGINFGNYETVTEQKDQSLDLLPS